MQPELQTQPATRGLRQKLSAIGLPHSIRLAVDLPFSKYRFRRVLPFKRSLLIIVILTAMDVAVMIPAVAVYNQAMESWHSLESLFDLTFVVFHTAWLIGWSAAPLILTTLLFLVSTGRDVIIGRPGILQIGIGVPGLSLSADYDVHKVTNMRLTTPPKNSGTAWRGTHISFDYAGRQVDFGSGMTPDDLFEIQQKIELSIQGVAVAATKRTLSLEIPLREKSLPKVRHTVTDHVTTPATLTSPSTLALIVSNLIPVIGMFFFGWRLSDIMVLYWAESAVIALYNVAKIAYIEKWIALFTGIFFLAHFSAFMAVHFLFIYGLFIEGLQNPGGGDLKEVADLFISLWPALAALLISHGISFKTNFIDKKEYESKTVKQLMTAPYSRITLMQVTLIFGGFLILLLHNPVPVLLLFIFVKIILDVRAHLKEHDNSNGRSIEVGPGQPLDI